MSEQPERTAPPITDQMREEARQTPDSWLYIVDPGYQDSEDVPPEGVIGAYRIDSAGEIDEDFQFNDEYQPSDMATSLPEPVNELERVLHRIAAGQAPEAELPPAVLDAELLLYAEEDEPDVVFAAEMSDGSQLVPACTSAERVPESWPGYRTVAGADLPEVLGGLDLGLNLDDAIRAVIPNSVLVRTAEERG
ncbi:type VII secretion system-associated protein [Saccharopolyspora taberi]|uniref:Type VII secretion system-associated protein n=1 Tax=Saccharopolyspora taberi TaxID=60895 RepID=A0ABN3VL01_9PSEU